ncbi:hypothetical protein D3C76_716670 [compost metagenome]
MTQVQSTLQLLRGLLLEARIDPLWQRQLAQRLLHVGDTLAVLRQVGIGIGQGVLQVPHEIALQLALAWEGLLPLTGHPVLDPVRAAVLAILKHSVHPERGHLLLAAGRSGAHGIDHTAGQGRQETLGEQAQVSLVDTRANGAPLIQTKFSHTRPRRAVVAKHRYRVADLVQRLQQIAPGRVQTLVHLVMAVLLALGEHAGGLAGIDVEVTVPTGDGNTEPQHTYRTTHPQ